MQVSADGYSIYYDTVKELYSFWGEETFQKALTGRVQSYFMNGYLGVTLQSAHLDKLELHFWEFPSLQSVEWGWTWDSWKTEGEGAGGTGALLFAHYERQQKAQATPDHTQQFKL